MAKQIKRLNIMAKICFLSLFLALFAVPVDSYSAYDEAWQNTEFNYEGEAKTIKDFKGKLVLMKLWAPWCGYCRKQMPVTSLIAKQFQQYDKFELMPVSIDYRGVNAVEKFYKEMSINNLSVVTDVKNNLFRALGLRGIPVFLLISPEGDIIKKYQGVSKVDIDYIKRLLEN